MPAKPIRETDLYAPVKAYLEGQGYRVKGEVGAADIVAMRGEDEPVVVELKIGFSLALFHQAIDRLSLSDAVYIAVPHGQGRAFLKSLNANMKLCRRLGIGLLSVRLQDGFVTPHLDPAPYAPRKSKPRKDRLLREFSRRVGDPNTGGSTRRPVMTAYRQDALRCAAALATGGAAKAAHVAAATGVAAARRIMADDHYGWFERVATGVYRLTPRGEEAMHTYGDQLEGLADATL